ncbi:hypothetical protein OC834_007982 [Tilletia horrida]|nr:hypothetical protein OC834_007982 [Tilletia horrida]
MRSHLRAHGYPSARAKLSKTQLAGNFLRALFCLFVLAAMTVGVMAFVDSAKKSSHELEKQRCGDPIPLAVAHCASHQAALRLSVAMSVLLTALAAIVIYLVTRF